MISGAECPLLVESRNCCGYVSRRWAAIEAEEFELGSRSTVTAEVLTRPAAMTDEAFARSLIEGSGIQHWNGEPIRIAAAPGSMAVISAIANTGRGVTI